jgi:hypothetical protein
MISSPRTVAGCQPVLSVCLVIVAGVRSAIAREFLPAAEPGPGGRRIALGRRGSCNGSDSTNRPRKPARAGHTLEVAPHGGMPTSRGSHHEDVVTGGTDPHPELEGRECLRERRLRLCDLPVV